MYYIFYSFYHRMYFVIGNYSVTLMQEPSVLFSRWMISQKQGVRKIKCLQSPLFAALLMHI